MLVYFTLLFLALFVIVLLWWMIGTIPAILRLYFKYKKGYTIYKHEVMTGIYNAFGGPLYCVIYFFEWLNKYKYTHSDDVLFKGKKEDWR